MGLGILIGDYSKNILSMLDPFTTKRSMAAASIGDSCMVFIEI